MQRRPRRTVAGSGSAAGDEQSMRPTNQQPWQAGYCVIGSCAAYGWASLPAMAQMTPGEANAVNVVLGYIWSEGETSRGHRS
jgi:hypothetical protein